MTKPNILPHIKTPICTYYSVIMMEQKHCMGPIIYVFDGRSPSRHKQEFLHLADVLMEYFLEGIALLRNWYINPNEKSNKCKSSLLRKLTKALLDHFLQGNVPLRHLLNSKPLIICLDGDLPSMK